LALHGFTTLLDEEKDGHQSQELRSPPNSHLVEAVAQGVLCGVKTLLRGSQVLIDWQEMMIGATKLANG